MGDLISELINDEGVCRTAPATPGLLNIRVTQSLNHFITTVFAVSPWRRPGLLIVPYLTDPV